MIRAVYARLRAFEDRSTLRRQVGIATAVLCLAMTGVLAGSGAIVARQQTEQLINYQMTSLAASMAETLDRFMYSRYQEIGILATLDGLRQAWTEEPARLRRTLEQLQAALPVYSWIGFATRDGIVRAATGSMLEGASVAERPWFQRGLSGPALVDVHDSKMLSERMASTEDGEPRRFVNIAFPVFDAHGRAIGVLGAHLSWTSVADMRARLHSMPNVLNSQISILAADGIVLLGPQAGKRLFSRSLISSLHASHRGALHDVDGPTPMLTGYAFTDGHLDYPGLGWIVISQRPLAVALGVARETALVMLGIGLGVALLGIAGSAFIAGRIARPLRRLTDEAARIGRDPEARMLPHQRGSVEVMQLTAALRSLLRRIGFAEQRTEEAEARAIENARQFAVDAKVLRHLAETDPLTDLMNRRAFLKQGTEAFEYFKRYRRSIAILICDIDHFKLVNDGYGHAAGDAAIRRAGQLIEEALRTTDGAARLGGDEFAVLLREVDEGVARALAERIRRTVEECTMKYEKDEIRITMSIGVALVADRDRDIENLIERADQALYMAKNTGRNRVFFMPARDLAIVRQVA